MSIHFEINCLLYFQTAYSFPHIQTSQILSPFWVKSTTLIQWRLILSPIIYAGFQCIHPVDNWSGGASRVEKGRMNQIEQGG